MMDKYPLALRILIRLLLAFLIVMALIITKTLLVPLFFSVLLAYMLYPAAKFLEGKGTPRIATNFILILGTAAIIVGSVYLITVLIVSFTSELPQIQEQFRQNINSFQRSIGGFLGVSEAQQDSLVESAIGNTGNYVKTFFTATTNSILAVGLIPVYTFLLLFYRDKFKKFIEMIVPGNQNGTTSDIIDQISDVVPQYMKGLFVVCIILIGINSLGFYLIGVKYALLFGTIAAIFNLIPYLGTVIGYVIVFLFVLGTQSPGVATAVVVQFLIVQFIENNLLTPRITGSYVRVNPLVTILSLLAGGMVWGLPGMFMVIPYLAIMMIVCENVDSMKPIGFLLGNDGASSNSRSIYWFSSENKE